MIGSGPRAPGPERLPQFLIIGAMKAGTTTLYRDLLASMPEVFLPADKEPESLLADDVFDPGGRAAYASLFARARPEQQCGEASTAYTKRPDHEGVAIRARRLLGPDLRLIYVMRHPVERTASHIRHEVAKGLDVGDVGRAVRTEPRFVAYSRYAFQLEPWLACFGRQALLALSFEDYVANRVATLGRVAAFLGVGFHADKITLQGVYNRTEAKPIVTGPWRPLYSSTLYRRVIRPWLGPAARERLRHLVLPKARAGAVTFDADTLGYLSDQLAPDVAALRTMLGSQAPDWDL